MATFDTNMQTAILDTRDRTISIEERQKSNLQRIEDANDDINKLDHRIEVVDGRVDKVQDQAASGTKWFVGIMVSLVVFTIISQFIKG